MVLVYFMCAMGRVTWIRRSAPSWLSTCLWTAKKEQTNNSMSRMVVISETRWLCFSGATQKRAAYYHGWRRLYRGQPSAKIRFVRPEIWCMILGVTLLCAFILWNTMNSIGGYYHGLPPLSALDSLHTTYVSTSCKYLVFRLLAPLVFE